MLSKIQEYKKVNNEIKEKYAAFKESIKDISQKREETEDFIVSKTQEMFDAISKEIKIIENEDNKWYIPWGAYESKFGIVCESGEDALGIYATLYSIEKITEDSIVFNAETTWKYGGHDAGYISVPFSFYDIDISNLDFIKDLKNQILTEQQREEREKKLAELERLKKELDVE